MNIASALQGSTFKEPSSGLRAGNGKDGATAGTDFEAMLKKKTATVTANDTAASEVRAVRTEQRAEERTDSADAASPERAASDNKVIDQAEPREKQTPFGTEDAAWPPPGLALMALAPAALPASEAEAAPEMQASTGSRLPTAAANPSTNQLTTPNRGVGTSATPAAAADTPLLPTQAAMVAPMALDAGAREHESPSTATQFTQLLQVHAALEARPTPSPVSSVSHAQLATPDIREGNFGDAFSARIGWLAEQKVGHAHVSISPPDLGQIEVKLQLEGDRVHATFASAHAEVRHALENSIPRLREMLGDSGLQLAHADVRQQQNSQQQAQDGQEASTGAQSVTTIDAAIEKSSPSMTTLQLRGLLDTYA